MLNFVFSVNRVRAEVFFTLTHTQTNTSTPTLSLNPSQSERVTCNLRL